MSCFLSACAVVRGSSFSGFILLLQKLKVLFLLFDMNNRNGVLEECLSVCLLYVQT